MIIQHMCRNCGNLERFSREQLGQKFRCPLCNTLNTVSAGSLPPRKKSSSRKPSKAKSTPPPKRFIPIAAIVAAPCALIVIVIVCVVLFRPKQQTPVNLANDSDAPDTMQDASDETADAGPNADAPENQNVDGPEDAGAAVNNPDVPNAADPNARDIAAGRNPSPPDGELELFDSIDLNELTDRNRLSVCEMVETDHVDPGGGFRNSKDVVWTNVKTYTNPGAPTDFVVTVLVSSHYQSLTPRSTVINADGSVAARHVPVDVFKGGLRSVYVGNFKSRTTNVKFRSADPERFGQFSSGLPQGTWCFFHKGSRVPRVRGSFLAGKRHGLFQCFNAAGERIWMGEYAHGERLTSTTEVDRVPGLVARHFGLTNPVGQLDFSPSGRLLVVSSDSATLGDTDRAVTLMSTDTWQPLLNLPSNGTNIPQMVFSKDENLLIAFDRRSRSHTVDAGCWKITSDSPAFKWSSYVQPRSHHFSKDGSMLLISGQLSNAAAGERFHLFSIVNTDAGTIFCNGPEWKAGGSAPTNMMFSDDGRLVLAEYGGSSVSVYQTSDGTEVSRLPFSHLV
ncbi:MAG: WD40 repeat domain-containing protein, partial [Planctomycetaceae bacterium]|nr:WD40 repeat domain-containing protein [Planctomycetaceae bacterium]